MTGQHDALTGRSPAAHRPQGSEVSHGQIGGVIDAEAVLLAELHRRDAEIAACHRAQRQTLALGNQKLTAVASQGDVKRIALWLGVLAYPWRI
jgi:hypothetical protein